MRALYLKVTGSLAMFHCIVAVVEARPANELLLIFLYHLHAAIHTHRPIKLSLHFNCLC